MKRYFLFAIGIAILFGLAVSIQPVNAQVYAEFDAVTLSKDGSCGPEKGAVIHIGSREKSKI